MSKYTEEFYIQTFIKMYGKAPTNSELEQFKQSYSKPADRGLTTKDHRRLYNTGPYRFN